MCLFDVSRGDTFVYVRAVPSRFLGGAARPPPPPGRFAFGDFLFIFKGGCAAGDA